jgi:hypothetical protein
VNTVLRARVTAGLPGADGLNYSTKLTTHHEPSANAPREASSAGRVRHPRVWGFTDAEDEPFTGWRLLLSWALIIGVPCALVGAVASWALS